VQLGSANGRRALAAAAALAALGLTLPCRAAAVGWSGPADCQRAEAVSGQVERLIGQPLSEIEAPSFEVNVTHQGDTWKLELVTLTSGKSTRVLEGPSCVAVTDAAGVAMAMAIRATESAPNDTAAGEPPSETPPPAPPSRGDAPLVPEPVGPVATTETPPNDDTRLGPVIGLAAAIDTAALPSPVVGLAARAGLRYSRLRLELDGQAFAPSRLELVNAQSAEFTLFTGALLGCFEGALPSVVVLGCGGYELGRIAGEGGRGVSDPVLGSALWQALRVEAGVELPPAAGMRLTARFGASVPLARPDFQLDGNTVHRPASMTLRAAVGAMLLP
jgi:hypothetical protein